MKRVAAFAGSIDPLMMPPLDSVEMTYLVARGSRDDQWVSRFLPRRSLLKFDLRRDGKPFSHFNTESTLLNSNLGPLLKERKADALMITHRGSAAIEKWGKTNNIKILSTDYGNQKRFENKLWFDAFMKENGFPHPAGGEASLLRRLKGKIVLQEAESFGSSGTYFFADAREAQGWLQQKPALQRKKILARQFVSGRPYGITVFVHPRVIALSALRLQCFLPTEGGRVFCGIQWISSDSLAPRAAKRIETCFLEMASLLVERHFFGFAHFDFILSGRGEISILECNPRLSSATPQLFRFPELTSGLALPQLFVGDFLESPRRWNTQSFFGLPDSCFAGSLLDIPFLSSVSAPAAPPLANGLYAAGKGGFVFKKADPRNFGRTPKDALFYSEVASGEILEPNGQYGTVLTNYPLYDEAGDLTEAGRVALKYFGQGSRWKTRN